MNYVVKKIDIVRWSERDREEFLRNALSPAEINRMEFNDEERKCKVIVPQDKLSLAIGKKGQNARLAAKLTGWDIDISTGDSISSDTLDKLFKDEMNDEVIQDKMQEAKNALCALPEVTEELAQSLINAGFNSVEQFYDAEFDDLKDIPGISEEEALKILEAAKQQRSGD